MNRTSRIFKEFKLAYSSQLCRYDRVLSRVKKTEHGKTCVVNEKEHYNRAIYKQKLFANTYRGPMREVNTVTVVGPVLFTAAVLGVTHGIEPDHAAGILSLTSESGNSRLAAVIGACFAVGHVILVGVWIGVAQLLFEVTSFPGFVESFGTVVLGIVLVLLGSTIGFLGGRKIIHRHEHSHDEGIHHHYHVHLPVFRESHHSSATSTHAHDHSTIEYLRTGVIGALFALSPPLSMMAFISIVLADVGGGTVAFVVGIYAVAIVLTMAVVGSGIGMVFTHMRERGTKIHASAQILAAVLIILYGCYFLWQAVPSLIR